jgi:hypothetical protein
MPFNDNLLALPAVRSRLSAEAQGTAWWALTRREDLSQMVLSGQGDYAPGLRSAPLPEQIMFAQDMTAALNRHLHHDGRWFVQFTHPDAVPLLGNAGTGAEYRRWVMLWLDEDGDCQFPVENDEPFAYALMAGPDHWMETAESAWQAWRHHMRDVLAPVAGQTFKRAQGQAPAAR